MAKRIFIVVTTEFQGLHNWKDCPIPNVGFLRNVHRHKFFVKAKFEVDHNDRDIEFFIVKEKLDNALHLLYYEGLPLAMLTLNSRSCEMIAEELYQCLIDNFDYHAYSIEVWEDNENGAEVVF